MGAYFSSYRPMPSLLHGDLWGGNWGVDAAGSPVIFDPAVYYGDREADLAMTRLFGGFGNAFLLPRTRAAGRSIRPLVRAALYTTCITCSTTRICLVGAMPGRRSRRSIACWQNWDT